MRILRWIRAGLPDRCFRNLRCMSAMYQFIETARDPQPSFDVGLHHGQDGDLYLKKRYRVVAFEADPDNAARFEREIGWTSE